ncbi:MAG: PAS domain S-box protein, partial [Candidatus Marinimicrobia bacterium]|nr:PAS domain S-box protein [Candidatus Neomarinimicrobiota bacterium]
MNSQKIRLLLIEKDTKSRRAFKEFFKSNELLYDYAIANGFDKAESIYDLHSFDVIISDLSSVDKSASNILQLSKDIPIIITVTPADEKILFEALSTGVCDYLIKDTDYYCLKFLPWVIQKVLRHKKLEESHRRTELELREQEKKYRTIFEQSRDAIYLTTINGEFIEFNNSMLKLLGYTRKELSNLNAKELYYKEEYRDKFRHDIEKKDSVVDYELQLLKKDSVVDHELQLLKKDGTVIHCLLTTSIMYSKEGKMIGYQGSIRDISEMKKAELKMNELCEQLKSANIALSLGYAAE